MTKISTYRKVGTVKLSASVVDNDKIDYYRENTYTQPDDLSKLAVLSQQLALGLLHGDDIIIPTLEGTMIINNGD